MQARTGYMDCFTDCTLRMGGPWNPAAGLPCAAICAFSRKLEDTPAAKMGVEDADKKPNAFYVAECKNKCLATYQPADRDLALCFIGCSLGGQQKPVDQEIQYKPAAFNSPMPFNAPAQPINPGQLLL
jgi:hypothetical protein